MLNIYNIDVYIFYFLEFIIIKGGNVLKYVKKNDIITSIIRWDYMNNNVLISTAMLNAYWEKEKKDTLDLLIPFVKYSISKNTDKNSEINISHVLDFFKNEFGYESFPTNVIILIFNRLSPKFLKKERNKYYLISNFDDDIKKFNDRQLLFREHREKVIKSLRLFLNEKSIINKNYSDDAIMQSLISFFAINGICIIRNTALLDILKKEDNKMNYCIAQFILNEFNKKSVIFNYIEDMVKGFFVSTVISLQYKNTNIAHAKFKELNCYLDTRIIINALGLHLKEEKDSSLEMISMLKEKGAKLFCFEHNLREINDIILAYKFSLINPHQNNSHNTLETWDNLNYTITDVERYQSLLNKKIEELGLSIIPAPEITNSKNYPFNDNELSVRINENMTYGNMSAVETDIKSVASIFLLREGNRPTEIEKAKAIFVTSNIKLTNVVNLFLKENNICPSHEEISPIITDIDLSSIVWLKCYSTHKNYPIQKLIEYSLTSLEPTPQMLKTFFDFIDKIKNEGDLSEDEAVIIRTDLFCKKELAIMTNGDVNSITKETVYAIKEKLKNKYIDNENKQSKINYDLYQKEKDQKRKILIGTLRRVKKVKDKVYNIIFKTLCTIAIIVFAVLFMLSLISMIINSKENITCFSIISLIIGIGGIADFLTPKLKYVIKFSNYIADSFSTKVSDKLKSHYQELLQIDLSDIE